LDGGNGGLHQRPRVLHSSPAHVSTPAIAAEVNAARLPATIARKP
jgi:hypothetical protein